MVLRLPRHVRSEVYACEGCGALFVPGVGPDNIVEADDDDHADARRDDTEGRPECPICGVVDPALVVVSEFGRAL